MRRWQYGILAVVFLAGTVFGQWPDDQPAGRLVPVPARIPPNLAGLAPLNNTEPENHGEADLWSFDYRKAELRGQNQHWQLVADGALIKDFGTRDADAREALRIIRLLRLTHYGSVGRPRAILEYWLSDGQPPQADGGGLKLLPIDLNSLAADEANGQWVLRDAQRLFFTFGNSRDDALLALSIIRHYGFKQVGYVGQPAPTMVYFLANAPGERPRELAKLPPPAWRPKETPPAAPTNPANSIQQTSYSQPAGVSTLGQTRRIEPDMLGVRKDAGTWKLSQGSLTLADFGANQALAKEALGLLKHYGCTEQCTIGWPVTFSYYLVNGQPPRGLKPGYAGQSFNPDTVAARALGKNWIVCDGDKPLVSFGDHPVDANQLVLAIRRHRFDHLIQIGQSEGKSVNILARTR